MSDVASVESEQRREKYFSNMASPENDIFAEDEAVKFVHLSGEQVKKWAIAFGVKLSNIDHDILSEGVVLLGHGGREHKSILCEAFGIDYEDFSERKEINDRELFEMASVYNAGHIVNFDENGGLSIMGDSPNLKSSDGWYINSLRRYQPDIKKELDEETAERLNEIYGGEYQFKTEGL